MDRMAFIAMYPTIQGSPDQIDAALTEAQVIVTPAWGDLRELGLGLYAAHLLTLANNPAFASGIGTATSKRVGEVQISYARASGEQSWYDLTGYGQRFWALLLRLRARGQGAFVV